MNSFGSMGRSWTQSWRKVLGLEKKIMCKFERRHPSVFALESPFTQVVVVALQNIFASELAEFLWRQYWIVALLKCLHCQENVAPPSNPIYSETALFFMKDLQFKIRKGLISITFGEVYDEWCHLLEENGMLHFTWNMEDCWLVWHMTTPGLGDMSDLGRNPLL